MALKSNLLKRLTHISFMLALLGHFEQSSAVEERLPVLTTKQDIRNIRFVSNDGKFTYYQRGNGSLQFSTNYNVKEVFKAKPNTQYIAKKGRASKYMVVQMNELYHSYLSSRNSNKIYVVKYGTEKSTYVADGIAIDLHLDDQWLSYFDPLKKKLVITNHQNPSLKYEIKLANKLNPYFTPDVIMADEDTIIYTDLNKDGVAGILKYRVNAKKIDVLYKLNSPLKKVELCESDSSLFWIQYGLDPIERSTSITKISKEALLKSSDLSAQSAFYSSEENDIGDLVCDQKPDSIQLIKTFRSGPGKLTYDAAEVEIKTGKFVKLSEINFATSLIQMDKKLLLPYQDKFFVLYGEENLTQFDKLKDKVIK